MINDANKNTVDCKRQAVQTLVEGAVKDFAEKFCKRHLNEADNPDGIINRKANNVFLEALDKDFLYYTALSRSFDSTLGKRIGALSQEVANLSFAVKRNVKGPLRRSQNSKIVSLLEQYKSKSKQPSVADYECLRDTVDGKEEIVRRENAYYLFDAESNEHYLFKLVVGGDLDSKKAHVEKEALLRQFAILSNSLLPPVSIKTFFATAHNKHGEGKQWEQQRVLKYFAEDELLIGSNFWNFICKHHKGFEWVMEAYSANAGVIDTALKVVKRAYFDKM